MARATSASPSDAMARQPMAARASWTSPLPPSASSSSCANASQSLILSGFSRCAIMSRSGTMFVSASVAARWTSSLSENWRYSSAWMPLFAATRRRAVSPRLSRFVNPKSASKCTKSLTLSCLQSQSRGRMPARRWASVSRFGSVVTRIFAAAWPAKIRHLSDRSPPASLSATAALKPPCCTSVPRRFSSLASATSVAARCSDVSGDGSVAARFASARTPSAIASLTHRAPQRSAVSVSASSSAFCFVMRWSSSYCSAVMSISLSAKWRRRSSSFVTVRFAKTQLRP
mmetsp:Transcript_10543/g.36402  ORF Transcript_10543/g.36402 Transcript_10543/m.36402 type:complete len:287 (-) Transcript_10543:298-1158(-)